MADAALPPSKERFSVYTDVPPTHKMTTLHGEITVAELRADDDLFYDICYKQVYNHL